MPEPTPLQIEMRDPASLTPYVKNNKRHSQAEIDRLAGLISAFGFDQPIVVDEQGVIIKGHKRREAAMKLGLKAVPVVRSTKDEYSNMANRLADNYSVTVDYDEDMVKFELGTLARQGMNLQLTGISTGKLEVLMGKLDTGVALNPPPRSRETDDAPEPGPVRELGSVGETDGFSDDPPGDVGAEYNSDLPPYVPGVGLGSPVVQYNLIFDDTEGQERWYRFTRWLKDRFPDKATVAARLDAYLLDAFPEGAA